MAEANVLSLAVIIVHYRTPALLADCLASLRPELDPAHERIIVVDNASNDGSLETLRQMPGIELIASEANLGFAGANNLGVRAVKAKHYLLLNPDTVVRPGAIALLRRFLESHPEAAMVGPRLEYPDGTPQLSAFGDPTPIGELIRGANIGVLTRLLKRWEVYGEIADRPMAVDWVAGACLLIRAEVFAAVGLLDDGYFMYYEEVDFCRRARRAGYPCWYLPTAHVVHLVGQASGVTSDWERRRLPRYWFESRHRYFRTHFGYFGALAADLLWLTGHGLMRLRRRLTGVSRSACARCETSDFIRHEMRHLTAGLPAPAHVRTVSSYSVKWLPNRATIK